MRSEIVEKFALEVESVISRADAISQYLCRLSTGYSNPESYDVPAAGSHYLYYDENLEWSLYYVFNQYEISIVISYLGETEFHNIFLHSFHKRDVKRILKPGLVKFFQLFAMKYIFFPEELESYYHFIDEEERVKKYFFFVQKLREL